MKFKQLFLAFISALSLFPAAALAEAFEVNEFSANMVINESGTVNIIETLDVQFSEPRHGIFRDIDTQGITVDVQNVTKPDGSAWNYEKTNFYEGVRLKIGDADKKVTGFQSYVISYDAEKVVRFFPEHDEFYWNVTGNGWDTIIHEAVASVALPRSVKGSGELRFRCYTGTSFSQASECEYDYNNLTNRVNFRTTAPLQNFEGLTIVVSMPPGTINKPAALEVTGQPKDAVVTIANETLCQTDCYVENLPPGEKTLSITKLGFQTFGPQPVTLIEGQTEFVTYDLKPTIWFYLSVLLAAILSLLLIAEPIYTFWMHGKDPHGRGTIMPEYEGPGDLSPAEVGTLVDEQVHMRDISSTIIDLCVRGYMAIKVLEDAKGFIFKTDDYEFIKVNKPKAGDRGLNDYEKNLMNYLFGNEESIKLSSLENHFYTKLPKLKKALYISLVKKGHFPKSPRTIRSIYAIKGIMAAVLGAGLLTIEWALFRSWFSSGLFINGVLTLGFTPFMPKKTKKGVLAYEHILGFKDYLETAEKYRLKFQEDNHLFYEYLPYAMTLKVANKWSSAFEGIYDSPPEWYQGVSSGPFDAPSFVSNLSAVSSSVMSTFQSQPSGSGSSFSGSGFSGGFSGGGFGGGGGGSW
jgi:uncharacterized membrane protein